MGKHVLQWRSAGRGRKKEKKIFVWWVIKGSGCELESLLEEKRIARRSTMCDFPEHCLRRSARRREIGA